MPDLGYVYQQFSKAARVVSRGRDDLGVSLAIAFREHIAWALPPGASVPADLRLRVERVGQLLSERPDPSDIGTASASAPLMTAAEREDVAAEIERLGEELRTAFQPAP